MKEWKRRALLLMAIWLLTLACSSLAFAARSHRKIARNRWSQRAGVARPTTPGSSSKAGAADSNGDPMVNKALSYRGTPYVWGGTSSRTGFDCSGFTRYIFGKFGITLPRRAVEQARMGVEVSRSELKAGDLMFFHTLRPGISHVSIYIGNGKMVHAANSNRGVVTDSIFSNYYWKRFVMARRVK